MLISLGLQSTGVLLGFSYPKSLGSTGGLAAAGALRDLNDTYQRGFVVRCRVAVPRLALIEAPSWRVLARVQRMLTRSMVLLRRLHSSCGALHSGCVAHYIAWLVAALAVIGATLTLT
jgi:hypothetical protein